MGQGIAAGSNFDIVSCTRGEQAPSDDTGFCRLERKPFSAAVVLNLYEGVVRANLAEVAGGGVVPFHCGVELYGAEWSFSAKNEPSSPSGIRSYKPGEYQGRSSTNFIQLGSTQYNERDVVSLLHNLKSMWPAVAYDHLHLNCAHFCDELCKRLGVNGVPESIMLKACAGGAQAQQTNVNGLPCFCCSQRTLAQVQQITSFGAGNKPTDAAYDDSGPDLNAARDTSMRRQLQQARQELQMANMELREERAAHEEAIRMLAKLTYVVREAAQESSGKASL